MQRGGSAPWAEHAPAGGGGRSGGAGPKRDWLKRLSLQSVVPWQHGHGGSSHGSSGHGSRSGARSASPAGYGSHHESEDEEEGVPPGNVSTRLLPASKTPEKAIAKLCKEGRPADILVLGSGKHGSGASHAGGSGSGSSSSRGHSHGPMHSVPGVGKLLSMMTGGESTTGYCREHLRSTRVVCVASKHE
ncbi:hypothetical protein ABPG75_000495 [Micractinium tetrahymenae]